MNEGFRTLLLRIAKAGIPAWIRPWICAALLAACTANPPQNLSDPLPTQPSSAPSAASAEKANDAKVALILSLSAQGHPGLIAKSLKQAAELAVIERDDQRFQLMVKDDKGTPEGAKAAAEDAIKGGAKLILGPLFAKSVTAVGPTARQAGVPVIAFSNDRHVAGGGVYLLSFQPAPEVRRVVDYAASQGMRKFAALISEDAFGKLADASFKEAVNRAGGTIAALETYPASATKMLEPMRKISAAIHAADAEGAPIDALFVPGAQEGLEAIGRLLPQAEIDTGKVKLIGTGGMDYPNAGRDAKLVGAWYPGPDPRGWSEFSQKYAKTYGQSPPRIASLAYDAVNLAIALGGGREEARYSAETITRSSGFVGIDGGFRLLSDGSADRALAILEVKNVGAVVVDPAPVLSPGGPAGVSGAGGAPRAQKSVFNFD